MQDKEINEAKMAVKGFVDAFFAERPSNLEKANYYMQHVHKHAIADPLPTGRVINNRHIDYISPSFWHACCAVIYRWVYTRMMSNSQDGGVLVYRGQANPYPILPSIRRGTLPDTGIDYTKEMTQVLKHFLLEADGVTNLFFETLDQRNGLKVMAQHHHFPTDFLDFTFNPLVALYFASKDSRKAQIVDNPLSGHGVIFESAFENFQFLTKKTSIKLDLSFLPPIHVPRIYQQQGFFLDCQAATNEEISEIELACERVFFPREYPGIQDIEDVFSENLMVTYLCNNYNGWHSEASIWSEREWYAAHDGYKEIISIYMDYIKNVGVGYQQKEALTIIRDAEIELKAPPKINSGLEYHFNNNTVTRAWSLIQDLSRVIKFVKDISFNRQQDRLVLNELVLTSYAKANPGIFKAINELAKKVSILEFESVPSELLGNEKIERFIKDSLSNELMYEIESVPPMGYDYQ